ncbi:hypothetical protein SAMN05421810_101883 [Amycolatopsis arida]|uniref:Uncharacterized protein n=1 Tax=Amycolatopsis arida TaxID=587909 RepID=A0A1I5MF66_9PSEU|nr:hypothetical protein [Amycolatopsis arida]TDX94057.1 hypothetical protein CLV69_104515 [Amycolatopsis arida]SFP07591.1 hypothetical protein SAMN05421810_101883 [Amycolatopsis arida]
MSFHVDQRGDSEVVDDREPAGPRYYAFDGRRHVIAWSHQNRDGAVVHTRCGIAHTAATEDARSARRPCAECEACPR